MTVETWATAVSNLNVLELTNMAMTMSATYGGGSDPTASGGVREPRRPLPLNDSGAVGLELPGRQAP